MSRRASRDLLGKRFGKLTVASRAERPKNSKTGTYWLCHCDCGKTKIANTGNLNYGIVSSCGCLRSEVKMKSRLKNDTVEHGSYVEYIDNKGTSFIVDHETHNMMKELGRYWYVRRVSHKNGRIENYVVSRIEYKTISLHRLIMNPKDEEIVDHIDGDGLNNLKSNLRIVEVRQNNMNKGLAKNNSSGYTGVGWSKEKMKWQARIQKDGVSIHLGFFDELSDAIDSRKEAEIKCFGKYSRRYGDEQIN